MKNLLSYGSLSLVLACSSATEVAPEPVAPTPTPPAATTAAAPTEAAPAALSPEEQKKAEEQKKLEADYAALEQAHQAELQRLTPELRAQVAALVDKSTGGIRSAFKAALKGPQRRPGHSARDAQRHPLETVEFLGVQPNHKVLEHGPGEGWFTELLAPALAKRGKLFVTMPDPAGPKDQRFTYYGKRTQLFLDSLPEAYGKVERLAFTPSQQTLTVPNDTLDVVLLFRGAHGMYNSGSLQPWLAEFHRALKPKGVLGIEQHRAAPGTDPAVTSKQGYLPEAFVIEEVQKAGFKLVAKSEINANPKDTKDHPDGVWSLPPTLRAGETDRAKYEAIGESDRMTLKFIKVAKPAAPSPAAAPAASPAGSAPAAKAAPAAAPAAPAAAPAAPAAAPAGAK